MAKLGEVCKLNMGQSPDSSFYNDTGDGIPFFQGNADFGEVYPNIRVWCNAPTKIAHPGEILISVRAPIGAMNIADCECCIGRGLASISVDESICTTKYLWYDLFSKIEELNSKGTGSTFKAINKKTLEETEVQLRDIDEQRKISETLDKITQLVSLRKQQLVKLDELVKARFVEMFGEPRSNPCGFDKKPLKSTCKVITGNTPSRNESENYGDFIEWIKTDNIIAGLLNPASAVEKLSEEGAKRGKIVHKGAILMACIAGSVASIGRVCVTDRTVAFNQQINAIVSEKYNIIFLYILLQMSKDYLVEDVNLSLKGILSKSKLEDKEFIIPPLSLQNDFAAFVERVDQQKQTVQQSLEKLELLKKALMQEYFG